MSPSAKVFSWYLCWNSIASKRVSCLHTPQTQDHIFVQCRFYQSFSSALAYTSQPCSEAISMRPAVLYIPYAASSKGETGNIIMFAHFEEGSFLLESRNGTESGDKSDEDSTIPPLIIEGKMDEMSSSDYYDAEPMHTDMLEDICDISQSRLRINRIETCYRMCDCIKQRRAEWKGGLLSTQNMVNCSHKVFKDVLMNFRNHYQSWKNQNQKFFTSFHNL